MLPDFQLPEAEDDRDRKLLADVAKFGWHVSHVNADGSTPEFSFSVGLYLAFGHPEILVMGLPRERAVQLINVAACHIAMGKVFAAEERVETLVDNLPCTLVPVLLQHYPAWLGYGIWFYRSLPQAFPALQLLWPDREGRLPREPGYDEGFYTLQRLLDVPS